MRCRYCIERYSQGSDTDCDIAKGVIQTVSSGGWQKRKKMAQHCNRSTKYEKEERMRQKPYKKDRGSDRRTECKEGGVRWGVGGAWRWKEIQQKVQETTSVGWYRAWTRKGGVSKEKTEVYMREGWRGREWQTEREREEVTSAFGFKDEELPCDEASLRGLILSSFLSPSFRFSFSRGDRFPLSGDVLSWTKDKAYLS